MKTIVLVGPTGIGKTDISLEIADENFEIISADSVQVYKYLDIGSNKPDKASINKVTHHLIDIVDPDFHFTAGHFVKHALDACKAINKKDKHPLFCGGTSFYINSFFLGLSEIPEIDDSVRIQLKTEAMESGLSILYKELCNKDPVFAAKISENDRQRILRGLEVFRSTGRPLSSYFQDRTGYESEKTTYIGLLTEREKLKKKIDQRVDKMIKMGFIDEIISIRKMGFGPELYSMKSIGYCELNQFLDKKLSLNHAIEKIKTDTKRYAKRQMTWYRRNKKIQWFNPDEIKKIKSLISNTFLNNNS